MCKAFVLRPSTNLGCEGLRDQAEAPRDPLRPLLTWMDALQRPWRHAGLEDAEPVVWSSPPPEPWQIYSQHK